MDKLRVEAKSVKNMELGEGTGVGGPSELGLYRKDSLLRENKEKEP